MFLAHGLADASTLVVVVWVRKGPIQFAAATTRSDLLFFVLLSPPPSVWGRCKDAFGQAWGLCEAQAGPPPSHEDMKGDMEIGAKHGWKYSWAVEDMPTVYCYGAVRGPRRRHAGISRHTVPVPLLVEAMLVVVAPCQELLCRVLSGASPTSEGE